MNNFKGFQLKRTLTLLGSSLLFWGMSAFTTPPKKRVINGSVTTYYTPLIQVSNKPLYKNHIYVNGKKLFTSLAAEALKIEGYFAFKIDTFLKFVAFNPKTGKFFFSEKPKGCKDNELVPNKSLSTRFLPFGTTLLFEGDTFLKKVEDVGSAFKAGVPTFDYYLGVMTPEEFEKKKFKKNIKIVIV